MYYDLDTRKIKTIEDIKKILIALNIKFSEDYENFDKIKQYLKDVDNHAENNKI